MGEFFLHRPVLAVAIAACLIGFGAAFVRGGLEGPRHVPPPPIQWDNSDNLTCIHAAWNERSRVWNCSDFSAVKIPQPKPYSGPPCREMEVDPASGAWRCLSSE